jgi:serine/threonine protein kinase/tetratricopeptide (TPR) repeat protein
MLGRQVSRYRVVSHLGHGGMGEVYLAEDPSLGRKVALKFLPAARAGDEEARRRLLREAQAAASLDHPFICKIYEVGLGTGDDAPFIAMEYVTGRTLKDRLTEGPMPVLDAARLAAEVAEAVHFGHERGIVHRDLKPSNILITPDGHAKVMDFGVAKRITPGSADDDATALAGTTATGEVVGTPAYMSPEQLSGKPVDARSDVFAFGLVLYEMLTGAHPYRKSSAFLTATAILHEPEPSLAERIPDAPPLLDHVIRRCLAKDPGLRYGSLREVHIELAAVAGGSTTWTVPVPVKQRNRRWVAALAGLVLVAGGLAAWRWWDVLPFSQNALAFKERDWIVLSDFENLTNDPVFDRSLRLALEVGIAQSQFVNVFPPSRIQEALQRMQRQKIDRFDEALASEVAVREGVKGVLACSIAEVGNVYSITARLIDPHSRAAVLTESESASSKEQVLASLDALATRVRRKLGESFQGLSSQGVPLPRATTASLQALKLYADSFRMTGDRAGEGLLLEAIKIDPDFALAHAELGRAYYLNPAKEWRVAAEQHYVKALSQVDRLTLRERLWITASAEDSRGNRQGAVDSYRAYLERYPDETRARFRLGWTLMAGLGRYQQAVEEFQHVIRINPSDSGAYINLASSLSGLRRDKEAREAYTKAFELRPAYRTGPFINHEYGFSLIQLGELDAAAQAFREVFALPDTSQHARAHRSLALLEMYRGRYGLATDELRQAVAINQRHGAGVSEFRDRLFLVRTLLARRQTSAAQSELAAAEKLAGRLSLGPEWLYMLGTIQVRLGRLSGARQTLASMQKTIGNPLMDSSANRNTDLDRGQLAVLQGEIARAEGRSLDAIPLLESAPRREEWMTPLDTLAGALLDADRLEDAAKLYEQILARKSLGGEAQEEWLAAHVSLGDIHAKRGRTADARAQYERLLALWKDGDTDLALRARAESALARLAR